MGIGAQAYNLQPNSECHQVFPAVSPRGLSSYGQKGNSPRSQTKVPKYFLSVKGGQVTYTTRRLA